MRKTERRKAFALLMTLLLLTLAAVTLAEFCRRSASLAADAVQDQDELQRRWGARSIETAVLDRADVLFQLADETATEKEKDEPVRAINHRVMLGGVQFEMIVGDEQAKLNLNAVLVEDGTEAVSRQVRSGLDVNATPLRIGVRPGRDAGGDPTLGTWSQVFEQPTPVMLFRATGDLTLWGDGRINFRRAARELVERRCDGLLTKEQIDELCATSPQQGEDGDAWINESWDDAAKRAAGELLTDRSRCYSLALAVRRGTRSDYHLLVRVESEEASGEQATTQPTDEDAKPRAIVYRFAWP